MAGGKPDTYNAIIELAKKSGIPFRVGSTLRPGSMAGGHLDNHHYGQAVDFSGESQDRLAAYFMGMQTKEVIHRSKATGKVYGSQNNVPYAPGSNGDLLAAHEDHVHIAMDEKQVAGIPNAGGAAQDSGGGGGPLAALAEPFKLLGKIAAFLTDPNSIKRIGALLAGGILLMVGLGKLAKSLTKARGGAT